MRIKVLTPSLKNHYLHWTIMGSKHIINEFNNVANDFFPKQSISHSTIILTWEWMFRNLRTNKKPTSGNEKKPKLFAWKQSWCHYLILSICNNIMKTVQYFLNTNCWSLMPHVTVHKRHNRNQKTHFTNHTPQSTSHTGFKLQTTNMRYHFKVDNSQTT